MDVASLAILILSVGGIIMWFINRLDSDMRSLSGDIKEVRSEMVGFQKENKSWVQHLTAMQAEQNKRSDQLYQILINMLEKK